MRILIKSPNEYPRPAEAALPTAWAAARALGLEQFAVRDDGVGHLLVYDPGSGGELNVVNCGGDIYGDLAVVYRHGDAHFAAGERDIHTWCGALTCAEDEMRRLRARGTVLRRR